MKYDLVFTKAWNTIWKHKALWLFGLLASCARNAGSGSGSNSGQSSGALPNGGMMASPAPAFPGKIYEWMLILKQIWEAEPWVIVILIFSLLFFITLIVVASFFFGALGRAGVARGAWIANSEQPLGVGQIFNESLPYFWRVFFLAILLFVLIAVFVSVLIIPITLLLAMTGGLLIFFILPILLPISLIMLITGFVLFILTEQAVVAIVAEDLGTFDAIQRAWQILRDFPFPNLVVGAIVFFGQSFISLLIALPFLLVFIPLFFAMFFETNVAIGIGAGLSGISFMLYLPFVLILSGMLHAYIGTVWVETFRQLTQPKLQAN